MSGKIKKFLFLAILSIIFINVKPASSQESSNESLYKRLGGYDAIAAVSDDFLDRLGKDPMLSKFLVGLNVTSKQTLRQHLVDFLCNVTGGPCLYLGKDMKTAHTGLMINDHEWDAAANDLVATLDKFNVPAKEKEEVLGAVSSLKSQIVGQ
jgi:hemoglobin